MRYASVGAWTIVLVAAVLVGHDAASTSARGVATPDFDAEVGCELLGGGMPVAAPGQRLELYRATYPPGSGIALHDHRGAQVMHVASGSFGWTFGAGTPPVVLRGGPAGEGDGGGDIATPGVEIVLRAGDALFYDRDVRHTARVIGDEPVVLLIAVLLDDDRPPTRFVDEMVTSTP